MLMKRMWINQPSTLQQHHDLHGRNVLAQMDGPNCYRVYFLSGPVVSMRLLKGCLSEGWTSANGGKFLESVESENWNHAAGHTPVKD